MEALERRLGLVSVVAISMGAVLSGLFVLPGLAFTMTGPSIFLAFLVAGLCVLPAALSKAELATSMPTSGGTYVYIDRSFGPLAGTIGGLGLWLSLLLKSAFALIGFGAYLDALAHVPLRLTAILLLAGVMALNILGVRKVGQVQVWIVAITVIGLLLLAAIGLTAFDSARLQTLFTGGGGGFVTAVAFVYISYAGVTKIAAVAEEVRRPKVNLPAGMMLSLGVSIVLYSAVTFVLSAAVSPDALSEDVRPIYTMAVEVGGVLLGGLAAILAVVSLTAMANSGLLAASRFPFAMSRDDLLPRLLGRVHRSFRTPVTCIVLTAAVIALAILFLDVAKIAKLGSAFMIAVFMAVNTCVIVLRETPQRWYQPTYRSPFYPWMQVLGIVTGLGLLVMLGLSALAALLGMAIPGVLLFLVYGRHRTERRSVFARLGPRVKLISDAGRRTKEMSAVPENDARVVVLLFGNERSHETVVEVGAALADGLAMDVIHVTSVPEQTFLGVMVKDDVAVSSIRRRIKAMAVERELDVSFSSVVSRDVSRRILEHASDIRCEWLVMEWRGRSDTSVSLTNPLGWIVNQLPFNLALFRDAGIHHIRKILVLAEPGPHDSLVVGTADHLAHVYSAELTFVRFVDTNTPSEARQEELDYLDQVQQLCASATSTRGRIVEGHGETEAVARITPAYDLLVMGSPRDIRPWWRRLGGTRKDRLTRQAACSVLRLRTPREQTHEALDRSRAKRAKPEFELTSFIDKRTLGVQLAPMRKEALFAYFGEKFDVVVPGVDAKTIESALWAREHTQSTALSDGVAMPHASIPEADRTYLGVFTASQPVEYQAPDDQPVDVFFVTVGPPSERNTHLLLLSGLSRLVIETNLLTYLREARANEELLKAFRRGRRERKHAKAQG